jgi:hypothetical protein
MTIPTPEELRSAYAAELKRLRIFGEILPGVNGDRLAAIQAAIYVSLPDEPILAHIRTESELVRQDERYKIRAKFFALVDAIRADHE